MIDMKIVIITRGRVGNQRTIKSLPETLHPITVILCPKDEVEAHRKNHPTVAVMSEGDETLNYGEKFHRIVNGHYKELGRKILISDDDLRFSMRSDSGSLVKATPEGITLGLTKVCTAMNTYPLVGLHPRLMGNRAPRGLKECTRVNALQGVNLDLIGEVKVNQWPILSDMVLNLTLLTRGQKTAIWCDLFWDQDMSNTAGGCSIHRTKEQQEAAVRGLAAMFPEVVSVRHKTQDSGGGFWASRLDFVIQWRRAYSLGVENAAKNA